MAGVEGPEAHTDPADLEDVNAVQTFHGIPIVANGSRRPAVSAFFERWGSEICVVDGLATQSIAHEACRARILTGTADRRSPDLAAITGSFESADLPLGHVDLSGYSHVGDLGASSGRVGYYGQRDHDRGGLRDGAGPFLNDLGGKEHWPHTSALVIVAGG